MAPLGALSQAWVSAEASLPIGRHVNGMRRLITLMVVAVMIGGCSSASPASATPPSVAASAAASTDAPEATPTPLAGLPLEIVGVWETDLREFSDDWCIECGPIVTLTIRAHGWWTISRSGGGASGPLTVRGTQIVFGPSDACQGTGVYDWQVEADALTFTSAEADQCARRADALDGPSYAPHD
jgi:hypothetical protein